MAMPSPSTATAGDITSSGSMPFLKEKTARKRVKGIITKVESAPHIKPMSVSFVIPAEGKWSSRHKTWARIPNKAEKEKLSEKAPSMLFKSRRVSLQEGFINPRCRSVLSLEPKEIPIFPRRPSIAGISTKTPGTMTRTFSIFPSTEPANAPPRTVRSKRGVASFNILFRTFFFLFFFFRVFLFFCLGIFYHLPDSYILAF